MGKVIRPEEFQREVIKAIAEYGDKVRFADVHGCLNGMSDMASDNLHPSREGYRKMGKFWSEVIEEYLEELDTPVDPDDPVILKTDFESGLSGWQGRGDARVEVTGANAAEGSKSAAVTNRTIIQQRRMKALFQRQKPQSMKQRQLIQFQKLREQSLLRPPKPLPLPLRHL